MVLWQHTSKRGLLYIDNLHADFRNCNLTKVLFHQENETYSHI